MSDGENKHSHNPVEIEDLPGPDQNVSVKQTENDQPDGPSVPRIGQFKPGSLFLLPCREQDHPCTKQHGKYAPHGPFKQKAVDKEHPQVPPAVPTISRRIPVGRVGQGHPHNIQQQDSQHRHPPEHINEIDPQLLFYRIENRI